MRLALRPPWWPPLIAALVWFALACPLINRALRALEIGPPTRLMVLALATLPVLGALRALVDGRLARLIAAEATRLPEPPDPAAPAAPPTPSPAGAADTVPR